jgi:heat shock protein HslJ/uncharacterized lipoprotein NlpE involved in copper resistance
MTMTMAVHPSHPIHRRSAVWLLAALACCGSLAGCGPPAGGADEPFDLTAPPSAEALAAVRAPAGFRGTLPCADCPGILTTIELAVDGSATLYRLHLESDDGRDAPTVETARWATGEAGQLIVQAEGAEPIYFGFDRSGLLALDRNGQPYDSALPRMLERLPRGEAAELTGTAWAVIVPAAAGEEQDSPPAAAPGENQPRPFTAAVRFATEGRMTGADGCNELVGAWSVRDGTLSITPAATSMRDCGEAVEDRARLIEAALKAATAYRIDQGQLVLITTDGEEVARLSPIA